ncbi:hypothetical protein N8654_02170 [Synechococcus sp. AH-601-B19]|nr:hypothetical protein [Synechococcus sp. AH-601-B19]
MMEEEEMMSAAAGCPPGHTYNPVIKKCLPGSPLSGISGGHSVNGAYIMAPKKNTFNPPKSGGGANQAIAAELQSRQAKSN